MNKVLVFVLALLVLGAAAAVLPVVDWLTSFFAWIENNRQISWLVFSAFYIAAVVLLLPGSLLTLGRGIFVWSWLRVCHCFFFQHSWGSLRILGWTLFCPGLGGG